LMGRSRERPACSRSVQRSYKGNSLLLGGGEKKKKNKQLVIRLTGKRRARKARTVIHVVQTDGGGKA